MRSIFPKYPLTHAVLLLFSLISASTLLLRWSADLTDCFTLTHMSKPSRMTGWLDYLLIDSFLCARLIGSYRRPTDSLTHSSYPLTHTY